MKVTVTYTGKVFDEHKSALKWDGRERSAWVLCNAAISGDIVKILPVELIVPTEADYVSRNAGYYEVSKPFINKVLKKAVSGQYHIIQAHIHPPGIDRFSPVDETYELKLMQHLNGKISGMLHASLVFSNSMQVIDGWIYDQEKDCLTRIEKVVVVRPDRLEVYVPPAIQNSKRSKSLALDRSIKALGKNTIDILGNLNIGVVGASALGGPVCELLARDRVKSVTICDPDKIDKTNLNRLIWATHKDIGKPKAEFYGRMIKQVSPETFVTTFYTSFYNSVVQDAFACTDIIFGCVDSGARLSINRLANANAIPYFDLGAGIESSDGKPKQAGGQVFSIIPGSGVCMSCSGAFDMFLPEYMPEKTRQVEIGQGYIKDRSDQMVVLIMCMDLIVSGLGYKLMLEYISGLEKQMPFQVRYDGMTDKLTAATCSTVNCMTCSDTGFLGGGSKVPYMVPRQPEGEIF